MLIGRKTSFALGGGLIVVGTFLIFAILQVNAQTESSEATVEVNNVAPTISAENIKICAGSLTANQYAACSDISDSITLSTAATDNNTIIFIARDGNGVTDLSNSGNAVFFHSSSATPAGNACGQDNNYCYTGITCNKGLEVNATAVRYGCVVPLAYYAAATANSGANWQSWVTVSDIAGSSGYATTDNEEIEVLLAGSFGNIDFGIKALGFEGGPDDHVANYHTNNGNVEIDFEIIADSDLGCSLDGTIPATGIKFDRSPSLGYATSDFTLSKTATVTFTELNAPVRTNDTATSEHTVESYWNIKIPSSGISGICSATVTSITIESS